MRSLSLSAVLICVINVKLVNLWPISFLKFHHVHFETAFGSFDSLSTITTALQGYLVKYIIQHLFIVYH